MNTLNAQLRVSDALPLDQRLNPTTGALITAKINSLNRVLDSLATRAAPTATAPRTME